MNDEEFLVVLDFKKQRIISTSYLMRKYNYTVEKAQEMMRMLSNMSRKDEYNDNGEVERVYL